MSNLGRQIEAFRAVMLTGGMTTAAETLHITQPSVSRLIRDLEIDLKITLFHRRGNQITPTAEATAFLAEVERSYLGLEQLKAYAANLRQSLTGSLRIAALPAMALDFLPYCLTAFSKARPKLSIVLEGMPSHLVLEQVMGGQCELGFTERLVGHPMLSVTPISMQAVVVLPTGHPLTKHDAVSTGQLANENIIMLSHKSYMRHEIESVLGLRPRHAGTIEVTLSAIACSLVSRGVGVTVVEPFTAAGFINRGVVIRPLVPKLEVKHSMFTAQHRPVSRVAQEFADEIQRLADEYLAPIYGR
jgi:DNA-binding transcriptional LysR family regulator